MSVEDKNDVEEIQPDKDGKYPESVPWNQYVGTKQSLGNKLDAERNKVVSLEEKLRSAISSEEHERVKGELKVAQEKLQTTETELTSTKEKTLTEKREALTKRGLPEDKIKDMSDKELDAALVALEHGKKVHPDLGGGGGGSGELKGSPTELATRAYESK